MPHAQILARPPTPVFPGRLARDVGVGFAYWLGFMLVLEPSHVSHALIAGGSADWDQEAVRIVGGGLLGAAATPPILAVVRRFPIIGAAHWRNGALNLLACAAMAAAVIAASCVLVAWFQWSDIDPRPLAVALPEELADNLLLLMFGIAALGGVAHALSFRRTRDEAPISPAAPQPAVARLPVKTRTGWLMVEMGAVDWIETQGNYLALHVGAQAHLVRETAVRFEARLDPERFVRIHRCAIAAVDRIRELRPLPGGDAIARLDTGAELRVSRSYRERVQMRLRGG
jgi:two-component system LytT family response regulator